MDVTARSTVATMAEETSLLDLVTPLWSAERTHAALDIDADAAATWRREGRLLGVPASDGPDTFYPVGQFETIEGRVRVKPALVAFYRATTDLDPWTVAVTLQTPAPELDGLSPMEWVDGSRNIEALVGLGETLSEEVRRR